MSLDDEPPPTPFAPVSLPETGTGERARRRAERQQAPPGPERAGRRDPRLRRAAFVLGLFALVASVPVLIYAGYSKVLNSTSGRVVNPIDDPSEPGYQANVSPTPVELVAEIGTDGTLIGAVVLSLTSGTTGGTVLFLPAGTVVPAAGGGGTLATAYAAGQTDGFRRATAVVLRIGFDGVAVVDPARWSELTAPLGPLAVANPDKLPKTAGTPAFASGPIELSADQVGLYLAARRSNESDLNRIARQQVAWEAWLAALGASSAPSRFPGETGSGFGRFVLALASGTRRVAVLPVAPVADGSIVDGFTPRADDVSALVGGMVPFPTSDQPGDRIRVRILDGVGAPGLTAAAARVLVPAGAEVVVVGNADRFGYTATEARTIADAQPDNARVMQQALGVGSVVASEVLDDVVDVTVVLGSDFAAKAGVTASTLATASSGGSGG